MSTQQTSQENPLAGFGPNEWIVEEMYRRYLADPTSVDSAWHDFFADYRPAPGAGTPSEAESSDKPAAAPQPDGQPEAAATVSQPSATAQPVTASKPAVARSAPAKPAAAAPAPTKAAPEKAAPAKPAAKPAAPSADGPQTTPLRGVAAKIVQNMDASLSVPTATSVRAIPAKLLVDNRIVINNHLARGAAARSASPTWSATHWSGRWSSTPR